MDSSGWLSDLIQIVEGILGIIIPKLSNIIYSLIYNFLVRFMIMLFSCLDGLTDVLEVLAGGKKIRYEDKAQSIYSVLMNNETFRRSFGAVLLVAMILGFFFCIVAVARDAIAEERGIASALRLMLRTFLSFLTIPLLLVALTLGSATISTAMGSMVKGAGGSTSLSTGKSLFLTASMGMERDLNVTESDRNNFHFNDRWRNDFATGKLDYTDEQAVLKYFHFDLTRIFISSALALVMLFLLAICIMTYMKRLMDIMLLYLVSPYFVAMIPLDQGNRFKKWRDMMIARACSGFSMVLMIQVVNYLVLPSIQSSIQFSEIWLTNVMLRMVFTAASLYGAYKSHGLFVRLINPMAADEEEHVGKVTADVVKTAFTGIRNRHKMKKGS